MSFPRLLLGLSLGFVGAGSALAVPDVGRIVTPAAGDVLVAGTAVEIRWAGLAADVEEMELLLSVNGGRSSQLRLTPQLAPGLDRYVWVVPNLPAPRATLRLRVGRRGEEIEGEAGGPFTIVGRLDSPAPTLRLSCGEWWAGTRVAAPPAPERRPITMSSRTPPDLSLAETVAPTSHEQLAAPPGCWTREDTPRSRRVAPQSTASTTRRPRSVPRRE